MLLPERQSLTAIASIWCFLRHKSHLSNCKLTSFVISQKPAQMSIFFFLLIRFFFPNLVFHMRDSRLHTKTGRWKAGQCLFTVSTMLFCKSEGDLDEHLYSAMLMFSLVGRADGWDFNSKIMQIHLENLSFKLLRVRSNNKGPITAF